MKKLVICSARSLFLKEIKKTLVIKDGKPGDKVLVKWQELVTFL